VITVRPSEPRDIDRMMEVFDDARKQIKTFGIDQWQDGYPNREIVEEDVEKKRSWVIVKDGVIEGTLVMMLEKEPAYDKIYEGDWLTNPSYVPTLVIHRIALTDALRGTGAASFAIRKALALAWFNYRVSIRVDTHEGNIAMRKMLERNGFHYCGIIYLDPSMEPKYRRVAYERFISCSRKLKYDKSQLTVDTAHFLEVKFDPETLERIKKMKK